MIYNVTLDLDRETDEYVQWARTRRHEPARLHGKRVRSWLAANSAMQCLDQIDMRAHRGDMDLWRARDDAQRAARHLERLLRDRGGL